ncbi:unnamed protein product [Rotaria magnacalcarata]|uniref:Neurofascin n=2 Tax=Rotaria magnacalcarata TaxID=392030 RepID=A0A816V335_9BILA|nr:unnamed protein product [Rotaria magnacalcarata]
MTSSNFVYILFLISVVHSRIPMPPTIFTEPDPEVIFDPRVNIELPCIGKGNPVPIYTWTKDGRFYEPSAQNNRVAMGSDSGTLIFTQAQTIDQGWYQCNATNMWGSAFSRKVRVRLAELGAFPIYDKPQVIQVRRGDSLKIPCKPPTGVPDPETYWTDNTNTGDQFGFLVSNPRVQQDYYGNLYFLNVKDEDEQKQFICNVFSRKLNVIRRGALTQIQVIKSDPNNRRPMKLWTSEANKVFLKGYKLTLKCIFGGLPTPGVIWRKINGTIPERRATVNMEKQELVISDLQYEDAGLYECRGHNELGNDLFSINVRIEADPYWISKPEDIHVTEGETVDFVCGAESKPPPNNIQWFINGVPLLETSVRRNPRRRVVNNRMIIQNVTKLDTAVYQCNVTNIHGYVFTNFFVNVISEQPEIQVGPDPLHRAVEGSSISLPCVTFGAPMPKVYWSKRDQVITGGRYTISANGSLLIREASAADSGVYICNATNKFGSDIRSGTLNVKRKTRIQTRPGNQEVRRGYYAIFRCTAIADTSLPYDIDWYKDGRLLAYTGRFIKDIADQNTLKIVDVQFDDGGSYVCRASTELDSDEAMATLVVQDRPNRPKITKVNCSGSTQNSFGQPFSVVQWEATGDNNARILYFELQYNTSFQQNDWISVQVERRRETYNEVKSQDGSVKLEPNTIIDRTTRLPSNQYDLRVTLSCWANYTFRIIAYNRIGASDPSAISESMCTTTTCRPRSNPVGVKAFTTQFIPLLIEWDSMPSIKWNAPKFWYEIGWRPFLAGANPQPFMTQRIYPPQNRFAIPNPVLNMRYQYYVKAVNQQPGEVNGADALEPPLYFVAFAGDSAPTYIPRGFRFVQVLGATTVQFAWEPPLAVDEVNIRGFHKAYQIEMFRLDDPENSLRVISNIPPNQAGIILFNAPANGLVGARIRIETDRYLGPTSPVIEFQTREGRPGPVTNLRGSQHAGNGILLFWEPPDEPNGFIIGYQIDYKTIESIVAQPGLDQPSIIIQDRNQLSYLIGGLKPNTKYRVQVRARTVAGLSISPAMIELTTNYSLVPSKPKFIVSYRGTTFFNVSFDPNAMAIHGSLYYVQYKEDERDGESIFKRTYVVSNDRSIIVSPLEPGKTYITILVSGDGIRAETKSDPQLVSTLGKDRGPRVRDASWFIGLLVSLSILVIVLIVVCGLMTQKGGQYSKLEQDALTHDEDDKFNDYNRASSDSSMKHSRSSLHDSTAELDADKRRTYLVKYGESEGFARDGQNEDPNNFSTAV